MTIIFINKELKKFRIKQKNLKKKVNEFNQIFMKIPFSVQSQHEKISNKCLVKIKKL